MLKKPTKKKWSVSVRWLEILWSKAVRKKYNHVCAFSYKGNCAGALQAHHVVRRAKSITKWDIADGVLLCEFHHKYADTGAGREEIRKLLDDRTKEYLDNSEKYTLKDYCNFYGITSDEFRKIKLNDLKEYINGQSN